MFLSLAETVNIFINISDAVTGAVAAVRDGDLVVSKIERRQGGSNVPVARIDHLSRETAS